MTARIYYQVKKQDIYIHTHTHTHTQIHTRNTHTLFYYVTKKKHKSIYTYLFIIRKTPLFVPSAAMARGPKKHLKRVAAPKHWMLDRVTGVFAPHPSTWPHRLRDCFPLTTFLRNRLKYALIGDEVKKTASSVSLRCMAKSAPT